MAPVFPSSRNTPVRHPAGAVARRVPDPVAVATGKFPQALRAEFGVHLTVNHTRYAHANVREIAKREPSGKLGSAQLYVYTYVSHLRPAS